jgi:hypothetical protein
LNTRSIIARGGAALALVVLTLPMATAAPRAKAKPKPAPKKPPAAKALSFAKDVWPIFEKNCVSCHGAENPAAQLNLTKENAYKNMVNVKTLQAVGKVHVKPGSPKDSYLVAKVENGHTGMGGSGMQMPPTPMEKKLQATIRTWVQQGAKP